MQCPVLLSILSLRLRGGGNNVVWAAYGLYKPSPSPGLWRDHSSHTTRWERNTEDSILRVISHWRGLGCRELYSTVGGITVCHWSTTARLKIGVNLSRSAQFSGWLKLIATKLTKSSLTIIFVSQTGMSEPCEQVYLMTFRKLLILARLQ